VPIESNMLSRLRAARKRRRNAVENLHPALRQMIANVDTFTPTQLPAEEIGSLQALAGEPVGWFTDMNMRTRGGAWDRLAKCQEGNT
jgi:hypothetical protein